MESVRQQKETLARLLGVPAKDIAIQATLSHLFQKGLIVQLHIGRWRAQQRLSLADLGITDKKQTELFILGQKRLLPPTLMNELQSIETSARSCLVNFAYHTQFGAFVPVSMFPQFKEKIDKYKGRYIAIRDTIVNDYDNIFKALREEYTEIANIAYNRYCHLSDNVQSRSVYVREFVARTLASVPNKESIKSSFVFRMELSYVVTPGLLSQECAEIVALIEEESGSNVALMADLAIQLRQKICMVLEGIMRYINERERLHPKSLISLSRLIENVRKLNWTKDKEIEAMITSLERAISCKDDVGRFEQALQDVLIVARHTMIELGAEPRQGLRSGQEPNIPAIPPIEMVRQARGSLGLDVDVPVLEIAKREIIRGERN